MRESLPNRRPSMIIDVEWGGKRYHVGLGVDASYTVRELFINSPKVGSDQQAFANDSAVAVSLALQSGVDIATLAEKMGRAEDRSPTSLLGHVLREAVSVTGASGVPDHRDRHRR